MKVEVEHLTSSSVRLQIEIPPEKVDQELNKNYQEFRKNLSVPGFRKGKVPISMIKSRFADHAKAEAIQQLIPAALEEAIAQEGLAPVGDPDFELDNVKLEGGMPLSFATVINIKPQIDMPDYSTLEVDKSPANVEREEVDKYIEQLRNREASFVPIEIDRSVHEDDCVQIDWESSIDGEPIENGSGKDSDIELGKESFHPDIESAIVGMEVGESKTTEVTFENGPEGGDGDGATLATFNFTLKAITEKQLPELDDSFAKSHEYENYDQMYAEIWNDLVEEKKRLRRLEQQQEVTDQLIEAIDLEIPPSMVDQYVEQSIKNIEQQLKRDGQTAEEANINFETLPQELRESTIKQTKLNWIFDKIAENENISITDDELDLSVRSVARQQDRDPDKYLSLLRASNRLDSYKNELRYQKICDLLIESASEKEKLIIT